jgi:CheY-like chemotaxis protein
MPAQNPIEPGVPSNAHRQPWRCESRAPLTILVAEDDSNDVLLLELALAKVWVNAHLHFVHDGMEATDYLRGVPPFDSRAKHPLPNLLLMDLKMPRMDGFKLLAWLQGQPRSDQMTVAVLSGSCWQADIDRAHALGANFFLNKPLDFRQLAGVVERMEDKRSLAFTLASTEYEANSQRRIPRPSV